MAHAAMCMYDTSHVFTLGGMWFSFVSELLPKCLTPHMLMFTGGLRILVWRFMLIKSWVQILHLPFGNFVTLDILTFPILSILIYKAPSWVWKKLNKVTWENCVVQFIHMETNNNLELLWCILKIKLWLQAVEIATWDHKGGRCWGAISLQVSLIATTVQVWMLTGARQ